MHRPCCVFTAVAALQMADSRGDRSRQTPEDEFLNVGEASPSRPHALDSRLLVIVSLTYWVIFWTLNGLDKFLHSTDFGVFHWYGNNREKQFDAYFLSMNIPASWAKPVLFFAGVWELLVGFLFLATLIGTFLRAIGAVTIRVSSFGFVMAGSTLVFFSAFDIVSGDRRELLEHGLYLMFIILTWMIVSAQQRRL